MKKINVKTSLRDAAIILALSGGVLFSAGCTGVAYSAGPDGYYDYDYYPADDFYFYPRANVYYWNDHGHWRSGRQVPPQYVHHDVHAAPPQHLHVRNAHPWTEHHPQSGKPPQHHH